MTRERIASSQVIQGRELHGPFEETADVVVVGSGAGGAVVAAWRLLSNSG